MMGPRARRFKRPVAFALAILSLLATDSAAFAAPRRVAMFPFELLDTSLDVQMRDAKQIVEAASADMRRDRGVSWKRALDWLVRNGLLAEPTP
jgi:hypothetical protein